jgi:hypothetical protein
MHYCSAAGTFNGGSEQDRNVVERQRKGSQSVQKGPARGTDYTAVTAGATAYSEGSAAPVL